LLEDLPGQVTALTVDASGNVYAGGVFSHAGGQSRTGLAKLAGSGAGLADATWNPLAFSFTQSYIPGFYASSPVSVLVVGAAGTLLAGGEFTRIGGQTKTAFASLATGSTGAADTGWASAQTTGSVLALARDSTDRIVLGGDFQFMGDGVTVRNNIARLNADGTVDSGWAPEANSEVDALVLDGSDNPYVGGKFTAIGGQARNRIARLSAGGSGAADAGWNPNADGPVVALALDAANSAAYAGGNFAHMGGAARAGLAKVSMTGAGAVDASWNPNPVPGLLPPVVSALLLDGGGQLYAGGNFTAIGGQTRTALARLATTGTGSADAGWNPNTSSSYGANYATVGALAFEPGNANLYAGGFFDTIGGQPRSGLARLGVATALADAQWNPGPVGAVLAVATDGNGHVYAGGTLGSSNLGGNAVFGIGGAERNGIARLSASGSGASDCAWIADTDHTVFAIVPDAAGNVHVGGNFSFIAGGAERGYAKLGPASQPGCKLAITAVDGGITPSAGVGFPVVVQAQDASGLPQRVVTSTVVNLSVQSGTGALGGTLSCQIDAGGYTCTLPAVTYSKAESGVVLAASRGSGDVLASGNSAPLTVIATPPPAQFGILGVNGGADPVAAAPFTVIVQAQDASGTPRNVVVDTDTGISVSTGSGILLRTLVSRPTCRIPAGSNSCSLGSVIYSKAETGVVLTVYAAYGAGIIAGNSQPFTVDAPPGAKVLSIIGDFPPVTSSPPGLDCTATFSCSAAFPTGTVVTLNYNGANGTFGSWSGGCTGTATSCQLTLNSDTAVSINTHALSSITVDASIATQSTTSAAGTQTRRIDQPQTRIIGRFQGAVVYDHTFGAAYADLAVQAGVAAAGDALRIAAKSLGLPIGAPALTMTTDTLLSSTVAYSDAVTVTQSVTSTPYVGPAVVPVGDRGNCILIPSNCPLPESTVTVGGGAIHTDTLVATYIQTARTVVTTETHRVAATYQIGDLGLSSNATLTGLSVSAGTLSPAYAIGTTAYTDSVLNGVASITVTPTIGDATATVAVNGTIVASGSPSPPIALAVGVNTISVVVTAQDGVSTSAHTIAVTRAALPAGCVAPPPGLVSWWPGDGNANDLRGGNNATLQGSAAYAAGQVLQAFSMAANGYVNAPYGANLSTPQVSVSAWVNPNSQQGPAAIVNRRPAGNATGWTLEQRFDQSGLVLWNLIVGGTSVSVVSNTVLPLHAWTHVAGTYDGATARLYFNGVEVGSTAASGSIDSVAAGTALQIGRNIVTGAQFDGLIDEIAVFSRALTPAELTALTAAGSFGACKALIDVDANGQTDALTDGLMILRYLFGLSGTSITTTAIGVNATRNTPAAIQAYLDQIRPALDVDGNGQADALTDGLLIIRYLFGLRDAALIQNAVAAGAPRGTATLIQNYIGTLQ